jgi:hypothetical protein
MNVSLHQAKSQPPPHRRPLVHGDQRPVSLDIERLHASDEAAAIERILDDVAESAENHIADRILAPLQQTLHVAILTGEVAAWKDVYRLIEVAVAGCNSQTAPGITRLRSFLAENTDLAD